MSDVYNHCTRCGCELSESMQQKYEEKHQGGPILCRACIGEVIKQIGAAVTPVIEAYQTAMKGVLESLAEGFTNTNDE